MPANFSVNLKNVQLHEDFIPYPDPHRLSLLRWLCLRIFKYFLKIPGGLGHRYNISAVGLTTNNRLLHYTEGVPSNEHIKMLRV